MFENISRINHSLDLLKKKYFDENTTQQELMKLYELEDELSEYIPKDSSNISDSFVNDFKEIIQLIREAENME